MDDNRSYSTSHCKLTPLPGEANNRNIEKFADLKPEDLGHDAWETYLKRRGETEAARIIREEGERLIRDQEKAAEQLRRNQEKELRKIEAKRIERDKTLRVNREIQKREERAREEERLYGADDPTPISSKEDNYVGDDPADDKWLAEVQEHQDALAARKKQTRMDSDLPGGISPSDFKKHKIDEPDRHSIDKHSPDYRVIYQTDPYGWEPSDEDKERLEEAREALERAEYMHQKKLKAGKKETMMDAYNKTIKKIELMRAETANTNEDDIAAEYDLDRLEGEAKFYLNEMKSHEKQSLAKREAKRKKIQKEIDTDALAAREKQIQKELKEKSDLEKRDLQIQKENAKKEIKKVEKLEKIRKVAEEAEKKILQKLPSPDKKLPEKDKQTPLDEILGAAAKTLGVIKDLGIIGGLNPENLGLQITPEDERSSLRRAGAWEI